MKLYSIFIFAMDKILVEILHRCVNMTELEIELAVRLEHLEICDCSVS